MKERYIILGVLSVTLIALAVAIMLPPEQKVTKPTHLPWQISQHPDGSIEVFGITLGTTPLVEAQSIFVEEPEVSLFVSKDGSKALEAYFERINLDGIRAKAVLTLDLTQQQLQKMFERGARIATMGDGTRKVTLSSNDMRLAMQTPIGAITYLPKSNLEPEVVRSRFGEPALTIAEPRKEDAEGTVEHWLYPSQGLDIAVHSEAKEVLQYLPPKRFEAEVVQPLQQSVQQ